MLARPPIAFTAAIVLAAASAPAVLAECTDTPPRADERLNVAHAFAATVTKASNTIDPDNPDTADFNWHVELRVDRLYRGELPRRLSYSGWAVGCHELRGDQLHAGDRLLVVSNVFTDAPRQPGADPFAATNANVVAWKRVDGNWRFYEEALDYGADRRFYPAAARRATTTAEILRLLSVGFLPDTATEAVHDADGGPSHAPFLVFAVAFALAVIHRAVAARGVPRA